MAAVWGSMKKGLQERELHLSIPQGSRNNPVTSSQPRRKSNKEKNNVNEKEKKREPGQEREKVEESSTVREGGREGETEWECEERKAKLQAEGGRKKKCCCREF